MKLGIITDCVHYKTPDGKIGTENHILLRQFEALCSTFSESLICCPFASYDDKKVVSLYSFDKIKFTAVPKAGGNTLKAKFKLISTIPAWFKGYIAIDKFSDVVYQRFPNNLNVPGFLYFFLKKKKVFATYTGTWKNHSGEPLTYKLQRSLLAHFFRGPVWVYSEKPITNKRLHAGFSPSYSTVEWNAEIEQVQQRIAKIKTKGLTTFNLITVGTLIDYKNQLSILRSCLMLKKEKFPFFLTIVGDGPMRKTLEKFISDHNLKNDVSMLGKLKADELKQLYRRNDFVVQAPLYEGFGKVPVEGFFHGLVPIINNISLAQNITGNEERGYLFDATNDANLVKVLFKIKGNVSNLPSMIEQGRAYAYNQTLDVWVAEYYNTVKKYVEEN